MNIVTAFCVGIPVGMLLLAGLAALAFSGSDQPVNDGKRRT